MFAVFCLFCAKMDSLNYEETMRCQMAAEGVFTDHRELEQPFVTSQRSSFSIQWEKKK